jgi:hypothetical protein
MKLHLNSPSKGEKKINTIQILANTGFKRERKRGRGFFCLVVLRYARIRD